jgi:hypothetical protein
MVAAKSVPVQPKPAEYVCVRQLAALETSSGELAGHHETFAVASRV